MVANCKLFCFDLAISLLQDGPKPFVAYNAV